ncbi:LuxR family transcriptional regulator [Mesorhizobium sp. M0058]|uniref:LuxR family transcriptional regulator n=1 Tax=Mesorhizobium sp. M0058 TaxID=2956865 RepID=UPI0033387C3C
MEGRPITAVSQTNGLATKMSDRSSLVPSMHFPTGAREAFAMEFGRFLDQADTVAQSEQLFDLLSNFALNLDCPWIAYGPPTLDQRFLNPIRRDPPIMLNYPDGWQERYLEMGYDRIDPIIKTSRQRTSAFRWSDVYKDANTTEQERRVLDEAATFGLRSGISVPLHGPQGRVAIMSFAQCMDHGFPNRAVTYLELAALHFHLRHAELSHLVRTEGSPELSSREIECILWAARGKTSWEIATIIGISINTVNFHIRNVMRKLDTGSRTVAAIRAVNIGIVEP